MKQTLQFGRIVVVALLVILPRVLPAEAQTGERSIVATFNVQPQQVYVNQPFVLSLSIRAQNVVMGKQFNLQGLPAGEVLKLGAFQELPARRETVGTDVIEVHEFRSQAKALQAGVVEISSTLLCQELTQQRTWLGTTTFQNQRQLRVAPLTLPVKPLPESQRPADFSGAVGQFEFKVTAAPQEAAVGDLITLTLSVTGNGHLEGVPCPTLTDNPSFKIYPPRPASGVPPEELRYEQIIIPQSPESTALPTAHFTYFDPLAEQYRTIEAGAGTLQIHTRDSAPKLVPYRPKDSAPAATPIGTDAATHKPIDAATVVTVTTNTSLLALPRLILMAGALMLAWAAVSLAGAWRRRKRGLPIRRLMLGSLCQALLALATWPAAKQFERQLANRRPVWTIQEAVTARLAPSRSAVATAELAAHTPVTVTETWENWLRVADGPRRGWIPLEAARSTVPTP